MNIEPTEINTADKADRNKLIRLIEFLTKLASLRSKVVRDCNDYQKVLWISDIPHVQGCFTQAWGRDEDFDSDIWIEIQGRPEPELPNPHRLCNEWINSSSLRNKTDKPELYPEITKQVRNLHWNESSDQPEFFPRTEYIEDHPEVKRAWDLYIAEHWLQWAKEHNIWESIYKVYSLLFAIHQEQLRLGEEYELVLGLGLLRWQTPTDHRINRHLIVANASLEFETRLRKFTIRPNPDGAGVRPELDMMEVEYQPAHAEEAAKSLLVNSNDDPWEKDCIEGLLQALVHSINPLGVYHNTVNINNITPSSKPIVDYAPALILRKRSVKGLTETLKRIKENIIKGEDIPCEFGDLAEIQQDDINYENEPNEINNHFNGEVFFPKPSNDEQRRIVEKIQSVSGVLVQGPPGTGKSHTIANLICHLLATGQRTLITAKTPRALQVLEGLVPEELRPLCINLLGSGLEEKRSLEASVSGILRKNDEWKEILANIECKELEQHLRNLREEKVQVDRRLRDIRESETYSQSIGEGTYRGTAARIAEAVNRNRKDYEWFTDIVPANKDCQISESELKNILETLRYYSPEKRDELCLEWSDDLITAECFAELVENEKKAVEEEIRFTKGANDKILDYLTNIEVSSIESICDSLATFNDARRRLVTSSHPWMRDSLRDVINGISSSWRELYRITIDVIGSIESIVSIADDTNLEVPDDIDIRKLLVDASALKKHIEHGGKLGWGIFRPKLVKELIYIIKTIRVNGQLCTTVDHFSILDNALRVKIECERAWKFWGDRCNANQGPYVLQLQTLKSYLDSLDSVLSIEMLIAKCRDNLKQCPHIGEPLWNNELQVEEFINSCRLSLANHKKRLLSEEIQKIEQLLIFMGAKTNSHPINSELLQTIRNRDIGGFARCSNTVKKLEEDVQKLKEIDESITRLCSIVPRLTKELERTFNDACWETRVNQINNAWHWAQARFWIEEYIRKEDTPSLAKRAKQLDDEINANIAKLASLHAWSFCFSRLNENHRRNMVAWQQSMRRLGKGTGKHAPHHRREAQKHLNECREAVPAWVMPLHRVWDTVDPASGIFDVIIIDEASQCGFEALPLFYLGKKILIVGDDKQISPDAVGLSRDAVHRLMEEYLYDFQFKASFDVESSLFAHGQLRYGTRRIILREHFRCMPEIIRFSNDLCYSDTPLIPLRQYGPDRLKPLEHIFVSSGYREGSNNYVINRPEAEAIAEKIVEICGDKRYNDKTMGVVVLQGETQASLIEEQLLERLGAEEMERRRIVCGNPYSFQGDERDIMFISMVAAPNQRIGPFTKSADERRFNVAASRARDQMILFHSVTCDDLSKSCLRRRLLEFFKNTTPQEIAGIERYELERRASLDNRSIVKPPEPFDSWFEVDVALELLRKGYIVNPQFAVAGKRIDLVVEGGQSRLAVECDGDEWHGADNYEKDTQRQRQLERCGWEFFRVRESSFYLNKDNSLQGLWRLLEERGIQTKVEVKNNTNNSSHKINQEVSIIEVGDTVVYVNIAEPQSEKKALISRERSNPEWGIMNVDAPIAQALIGASLGAVVEAKLPLGIAHLLVKNIIKGKM